jgi:hypothetical protein
MQLGNFLNWLKISILMAIALMMVGCATPVQDSTRAESTDDELKISAWTQAPLRDEPAEGVAATANPLTPGPLWHHHKMPGKSPTHYAYARMDGRDTMAVNAVSSASILRQKIHIPAAELASSFPGKSLR